MSSSNSTDLLTIYNIRVIPEKMKTTTKMLRKKYLLQ